MNMQWLIGFTLLIIMFSMAATLGLADIDLLNPTTSQAEAERISVETRHLEVMNQLEEQRAAAKTEAEIARIRHEQGLEEARYQAELARIAADQAYYERMQAIKANAYEAFMIVLIIVASAGGVSLLVIVTKSVLARIPATVPAHSRMPARLSNQQPVYRHSPNGYEMERINARQRELLEIAITQRRVRTACAAEKMNREEYNKLPLAQ